MIALRERNGYLFDEDGLGLLDETRGVLSFLKGGGARRAADTMPRQTRTGQRNLSDEEMVAGQARYHIAPQPPPGFGVAWLHGRAIPEERIVYLDCDAARPHDSRVAYGLPAIYHDDGSDPPRRSTRSRTCAGCCRCWAGTTGRRSG